MLLLGTGMAAVVAACGDAAPEDALSAEDADAASDGARTAPGHDAALGQPDAGGATSEGGSGSDAGGSDASDGGETDAASDAGADADATVAPAFQVDFTAQPPSGYSGVALGAVTVRVRDAQGQAVGAPTSVTLSLTSGPGALGGIAVRDTTAGLATFDDLTVSKSGVYTLTATAAGATGQSATFDVSAWQPYAGTLTGGTVRRIVVDPTDANVAFAATDGAGIYRTTDGATWTPVAFAGTSTVGLAIDPVTPTTIYAGQGTKGLWKSTDRGLTWKPANAGYADRSATAIAIDRANTQIIYWGTNKGLLKSTDGGASWSPIGDPAFAATQIAAVAVAPSNTLKVYVQCYDQQVYASPDGGGSWTPLSGLPASVGVRSFAVHPSDDGAVYAALGQTKGGVWKSTGGGAFTQVANAPVASASVEDIAIDPSSPATMYLAAYGSNVHRSVDGGATWTSLNDNVHGAGSVLALAMAPSDESTLYVGHYLIGGGGFSKTTNGGAAWADASKGFTAFSVNGIAVDPADAARVWVGGGYNGVNRSTDKGLTYTTLGTSDGITWNGDFVVRFSPTTPGTLFVGNNGGGVFKSTNNGVSFVRDSVLGNAKLERLAPSPADPSTIYAGGYSYGLTATSNGGTSWTTTSAPANPYVYVYGLAAHPTVAATAYAGLSDGLYRTTTSGQTWVKLTTPSPALSAPYVAFDSSNAVLAAGRSVQTSPDGDAWTDITTSNGTTVPVATGGASFAGVFKVDGADVVFVGVGANGLWRRANGTWSSSFATPSKILTMAQDPSQPKTLYVGVDHGGMYRSLSGGE
jgi:hypothetical protein